MDVASPYVDGGWAGSERAAEDGGGLGVPAVVAKRDADHGSEIRPAAEHEAGCEELVRDEVPA